MTWARRGRLPGLLLSEATAGTTLVFGLLFLVVAWFFALVADTGGFSAGLADPLNLALTACAFLGPVIAGAAAVRSATLVRQGVVALASTTVRGRFGVFLLSSGALAGWAALGYLSFVTVVLFASRLSGPAPASALLLVVQALAFLLLSTVIGAAAGAWVPYSITGPVVAIVFFATVNLLDLVSGPLGRLSPIYADIFYAYRLQPNAALLTGVSLTMVAIALVVVAVSFRPDPVMRRGVLTAIGATAAAAGLVMVSSAPEGDVMLRSGDVGDCRSAEGVTLCAWPGPGVPFEESLRALARVRAQANVVGIPVPNAFHEPGLRSESATARIFDVPIVRGDMSGGPTTYPALRAVVPPACDASSRSAADDLTGLLAERLDAGSVDPRGPWAAGIAIASAPRSEQRHWVRERLKDFDDCQ